MAADYTEMRMASSLYDGGWRAADRDDLVSYYRLDPEVADHIAEALQEIEDTMKEVRA